MIPIHAYISAIEECNGLWRTLQGIRPCRDSSGRVQFIVGSSAVIFKVEYNGASHKLRCYFDSKPYLKLIYNNSFFESELKVSLSETEVIYADVVLEKWIEGRDLSQEIASAVTRSDFATLAHRFDAFALWLLNQEWAHGDLKPSNIIVHNDKFYLIDFDSIYLPQFCTHPTYAWGSAGYQHPNRKGLSAKEIDDYPIALISTALNALSYDPTLLHRYPTDAMLLIDPNAAIAGEDKALQEIENLFQSHNNTVKLKIANLLRSTTVALPTLQELLQQPSKL